ncbi:MAG TPA: response regulator, partial [Spirochaetia bacterium]|nr:response regulator [Spirochaetia bacterium]
MSSARILVAEDEVLVGLALKRCLEGFGYDVPDVVASGEQAVEKSRALEADLVVMDIHLDGAMTGIEAAAAIKQSSRVPVVYLTAYSDEATLGQAKVTEPFGYILKPFEEKTLQATLEMALYKARSQNELQDTKERLSIVLESIGDAILVTDVNGAISYANNRALALLRLPVPLPPFSSIFTSLRATDGVTGNDLSYHLKEVVAHGRGVRLAHCVLTVGEGQVHTVDLALEPYRDSPGSARGTIFVLRDTTERAAIEDFIVKELRSAANMHKSLLPPSQIETERFRMSGFLMPAGFVAGDLYDFFAFDPNHLGLYLIDVAGHGVAASSLALLLNRLLSPGREKDGGVLGVDPLKPQGVVSRLNQIFTRGRGQMFFTICYAVIDAASREVRLVR